MVIWVRLIGTFVDALQFMLVRNWKWCQDINRRLGKIQNYIVKEVLAASVYAAWKARNRRVVRNEGQDVKGDKLKYNNRGLSGTKICDILAYRLNLGDFILIVSNPWNFSDMSPCIDPNEFTVPLAKLILDLPVRYHYIS